MSIREIISVAPMIDCTDRHFRYLMRLITQRTQLYSEMHTIKELLENKTGQLLNLHPLEAPIAIQLGGSHPQLLSKCANLAAKAGYTEVNLNVGCPSHRVQQGGIGACLMLQPDLVASCVEAMRNEVDIPITVKCRLGVDEQDSYEELAQFIKVVASAGCRKFIIHARKAWLKGLSPKQNREIPPLNYEIPYRIKQEFPYLQVILNGGITTLDAVDHHLQFTDGVMIGRAAYQSPYLFSEVDRRFYNHRHTVGEKEVAIKFMEYVKEELKKGTRLNAMVRHLLGLFHNKPKASHWRRYLSTHMHTGRAEIIQEALDCLD